MDMQQAAHPKVVSHIDAIPAVRELRDSLMLLGLAAVSLGGYVGLAIAAVRLFATR